jgi:ABC-type multidrug transport system fused ATPase/permease subunit
MTLGELLAFTSYAAMIFGPFITIARNWQTIQNGIVNIQETEKILETEPEMYEPANAISLDLKGDIKFDNVSFYYDRYRFDNVGSGSNANGLSGNTNYIDNSNNALSEYVSTIRSRGDIFGSIEYE